MEDLSEQPHFEFSQRRVVTESGPQRAACRYDSVDNHDDEEVALADDFYDLNMLPDQGAKDIIFSGRERFSFNTKAGATAKVVKPMKPLVARQNQQLPHKVFNQYASTTSGCFNSSKNLRNNNRYSSQNMKGTSEEEEPFEDEIAKECEGADPRANFYQTEMGGDSRRSSQRYKDRIRQIRVQSQETCKRDGGVDNTQEEVGEEEEPVRGLRVESEMAIGKPLGSNTNLLFFSKPGDLGTKEEKGQKEDGEAKEMSKKGKKPINKFQYQEILKRLSDMTLTASQERKGSFSTSQKVGSKRKSIASKVGHQDQPPKEVREPLKEKTQEVINTEKAWAKVIGSACVGNNADISGKACKKEVSKTGRVQDKKMKKVIAGATRNGKQSAQSSQQKILANMLMSNQENNFIEKKLKDQSSLMPPHSTLEVQQVRQKQETQVMTKQPQASESFTLKMKTQKGILNPKLHFTTSSAHPSSLQQVQSQSTNQLKPFQSSSALTQSSSNKQFMQSRETPECQRLKAPTAGSSTSKRFQTLTNSTIGGNGTFRNNESQTKRSVQSSEQKPGQRPAIEEIKKMAIGNLKDRQMKQQVLGHNESSQFYQNLHQSLQKAALMNKNEVSAFQMKRASNTSGQKASESRKNSTNGSCKTKSKTGKAVERNAGSGQQLSNGGSVQSNSKRQDVYDKGSIGSKLQSSRIGAYPVSSSSSQPQSCKKATDQKGDHFQSNLHSKFMAEFAPKGSFKSLKSDEEEQTYLEAPHDLCGQKDKHIQSNQTLKKLTDLVRKEPEQQEKPSIMMSKQVKRAQPASQQKRPFSGKPKQQAYAAKARPLNQNRNAIFTQQFASAQGKADCSKLVVESLGIETHMQIPHKTIEKKTSAGKLNYESIKPLGHQVKVQYTEQQYLATQNAYRMTTTMDDEEQHFLLSQASKSNLMHPPLSGQRNAQNVKLKAKNF